jgi:hypothetical protein
MLHIKRTIYWNTPVRRMKLGGIQSICIHEILGYSGWDMTDAEWNNFFLKRSENAANKLYKLNYGISRMCSFCVACSVVKAAFDSQ